jgi:hypothetical protein
MKQILLIIFLFSFTVVFSQTPAIEVVDFENSNSWWGISIEIDSTNDDNIWQIGQPQKTILNQAWSQPNVIITDTVNNYPINDTSSFYVSYYDENCGGYMQGRYFCDTDSLNDYGIIELSYDNGQTWINLLTDSSISIDSRPVLTGSSNGWKGFFINFSFSSLNPSSDADSLLIRFSFISDSIDTQHEGLMFDDLGFCLSVNTQNRYQLNNLEVFPNPATDVLNFQLEELIDNADIRIYSTLGQLIETQNINDTNTQFNVSDWQNGMYFYGIFVEGQLVKQGQILIRN